MSDKDASTPRVFLIRHGETEWSRNGRYTGVTDLPLLPSGEAAVRATARLVYGAGKLIDPRKVANVFVSPRRRAVRTWEILVEEGGAGDGSGDGKVEVAVEQTQDIVEWDYGDYDGKVTREIRSMRKDKGLDRERAWDIWQDGCEGGEGPAEVKGRLDALIARIRKVQGPLMGSVGGGGGGETKCDVVVVAHGHILRAFVKRWLGYELAFPLSMMLEPGGVCGLSYQHGSVEEPAVLVGMSFPSGQ